MAAGWQLFQLPLMNNAWMEQMYSSTAPVIPQQKKKGFNIADILSDDKSGNSRDDIKRIATHPYYPAVQNLTYTEPSGNFIVEYNIVMSYMSCLILVPGPCGDRTVILSLIVAVYYHSETENSDRYKRNSFLSIDFR